MKHDDPRLDSMEASYKLADPGRGKPGLYPPLARADQQADPVIKGVLPDAPAPIAEPRPAPAARTASPHNGKPLAPPPQRLLPHRWLPRKRASSPGSSAFSAWP
ncbi:hypothetical protein [Comamonas sp. JC664]|uniref:hypothetical protein n=1 Tax=Comamonas sp. JC664 TaxID=2801917 RepID=UPI003623C10B